jgi:hypothetical protein
MTETSSPKRYFSRFVSVVLPLPVPPAMPMIKLSIPQCLPFFFVPHA